MIFARGKPFKWFVSYIKLFQGNREEHLRLNQKNKEYFWTALNFLNILLPLTISVTSTYSPKHQVTCENAYFYDNQWHTFWKIVIIIIIIIIIKLFFSLDVGPSCRDLLSDFTCYRAKLYLKCTERKYKEGCQKTCCSCDVLRWVLKLKLTNTVDLHDHT